MYLLLPANLPMLAAVSVALAVAVAFADAAAQHQLSSSSSRSYVLTSVYVARLLLAGSGALLLHRRQQRAGSRRGCPTRPRQRRSVLSVFSSLGPLQTRRAYRMTESSFWKLHSMIKPYLPRARDARGANGGPVSTSVRLAIAIRYCAGGDPHDLAPLYGVGANAPLRYLWEVVDAVNKCPQLAFSFPTDHDEQRKIAEGFKKKSAAGIDCCVGAVDGLLIWINKPNREDCGHAGFNAGRFFCGRKHKFGLNLQGVCDSLGRFLFVEVRQPAACSDFIAFQKCLLRHELEKTKDFLAPGLCIFGDSAYVNQQYMATPYTGNVDTDHDAYNFYHSQLRINIECAFGMLVSRWGILRKAIQLPLMKVSSLVMALCRIHNFCINERESEITTCDNIASYTVPQNTSVDDLYLTEGGVRLEDTDQACGIPTSLMDGGNHQRDHSRWERRSHTREAGRDSILPRERLFAHVVDSSLRRPTYNLKRKHASIEEN